MKKTNSFGIRLERLCDDRGITPNELARRISIPRATVHEWIGSTGRMPRDPMHLKKLCEFFNIASSYLLWGEEEKVTTIDSLISKTDIHTGMYEITIKKVDPKSKK